MTPSNQESAREIWEGDVVEGMSWKEPNAMRTSAPFRSVVVFQEGAFTTDWFKRELPFGTGTIPQITAVLLLSGICSPVSACESVDACVERAKGCNLVGISLATFAVAHAIKDVATEIHELRKELPTQPEHSKEDGR